MNILYLLPLAIMTSPAWGAGAVNVLTDKTFEHDTQASTGQTTGLWAVRFCSSRSNHMSCGPTDSMWAKLAEDLLEEQLFLTTVQFDQEKELARRFEQYLQGDTAIIVLLRQRHMFVRVIQPDQEAEIKKWLVEGWEQDMPLKVPPEESLLDQFKHKMLEHDGSMAKFVGFGVLCVMGMLIFAAGLQFLSSGPNSKHGKSI